ncbi:MAG: hypothetical protein J5746_01700 [Victivallales bacterium]|nr:hypothetical protein [Victivallales bacterium]
MKSYLQALKEVSSLPITLEETGRGRQHKSPTDAQRVLMRGAIGLLWGLCGGLVCWLVSGDRMVGAVLGTLAVFVLRHFICMKDEKSAIVELSKMLMSGFKDNDLRATYSSLAALGLFLLRPFCTYVILVHNAWLWLPIAAMLGYTASLDCGVMTKLSQKHWIPALVVTLLFGAVISKLLPNCSGVFMFALVSTALCWLLPAALQRFNIRFSAVGALYVCEAFALLLGVAALAV